MHANYIDPRYSLIMLAYVTTKKSLLAIAVAIITAFISAKFLIQGTPLVSVPWGILAFLVALIAQTKREALTLGGIFGFVVSYSYLWFDNGSKLTPTKIAVLIPLIILPALFGLLCGLLCSWLGWFARTHLSRKGH
jgi:hypothetical protein